MGLDYDDYDDYDGHDGHDHGELGYDDVCDEVHDLDDFITEMLLEHVLVAICLDHDWSMDIGQWS